MTRAFTSRKEHELLGTRISFEKFYLTMLSLGARKMMENRHLVEGVAHQPLMTVSGTVDAIVRNVLLRAIKLVVAAHKKLPACHLFWKRKRKNSPNEVRRVLQGAGVHFVAEGRTRIQRAKRSNIEHHGLHWRDVSEGAGRAKSIFYEWYYPTSREGLCALVFF